MLLELAWLIPLFPFLAFCLIAVLVPRKRKLSHVLALAGIAISFCLAQVVFWAALVRPAGGLPFEPPGIAWLASGHSVLDLSVYVDPLSAVMLFMVPLVCLLIFVYSVGYMRSDPRYARFFAYVSLFATGMLGLVLCNNFVALFLFWEIMGACSYLLIAFWYEKPTAFAAGLKAFLVTKVGDLFLLLGLLLLYSQVGTLTYRELFSPETLQLLAQTPFYGNISVATVAALLIFGGTLGKSAQFPLHVWLPDAMEGPTPVSALIHAATMVSAGIYLVARTYPLFAVSQALGVLAAVGAFTALFAALIALAQNDIKRVLAFSTISQLGYMVAALGVGGYTAAVFHLLTHAFFKALLFLSSGSVIHGMEHARQHLEDPPAAFNPNDMLLMGGLGRRMPRTAVAFLLGGLSLSGFPLFTAGFWSKDEILTQAWHANPLVFWALAAAAGLTAFYTARQLCLTFLGAPRTSAAASVKENSGVMTVPLLLLAFFAVTLGWVGIPEHFPLLGGLLPNGFAHFVGGVSLEPEHFAWQPLLASVLLSLGGLAVGWLFYGRKPLTDTQVDPLAHALGVINLGWLYRALQHGFYIDQGFRATFVRGSVALARAFSWFDAHCIDAVVKLFGRLGSLPMDALDRGTVDALVNLVGRMGSAPMDSLDLGAVDALVNVFGGLFHGLSVVFNHIDYDVVDGVVNIVGDAFAALGRRARRIQTGMLNDYVWDAFLMILFLIAVTILLQRV